MSGLRDDEAQAAIPTLASNLLRSSDAFGVSGLAPSSASSGCAAIDEVALGGGFRYGELTCLSGAFNTGEQQVRVKALATVRSRLTSRNKIVSHAIVSHLLSHNESDVAYIDANGSFSPHQLHNVLSYRLRARKQQDAFEHTGFIYEKRLEDNTTQTIEAEATSLLDRVKVMRIFDVAGLSEAVAEVSTTRKMERRSDDASAEHKGIDSKRRTEIGDSEEESEDERVSQIRDQGTGFEERDNERNAVTSGDGMIVIATLTGIISANISKSPIHGQAIFASVMRSLHHISTHYRICTIIVNAAVGLTPKIDPANRPHKENDDVSIFASNLGKPALGKAFTHMIDTSLFLYKLPKHKGDALSAYGQFSTGRSWKDATVIEVLKDKNGGREGRWAAFEIISDVKLSLCSG